VTQDTEVPVPRLDDKAGAELPPLDGTPTQAEPDASAPVRRRRRRRTQPKPEATEAAGPNVDADEQQFAQALAMGFEFGGRIAAGIKGDHWRFSTEETATLGAVWAKALHPYMGSIAPYAPFIVATIVTAGYMMPRIQQDRLNAAENAGRITARQLNVVEPPVAAPPGPTPDIQPPPAPAESIGATNARRRAGNRTPEHPPGVS
jgi:hypothetical protein